MSQRKFSTIGESNDRCSGGDDGEDPPQRKNKKYHVVDHPQIMRKSEKSPKSSELEIFKYLEDMEVGM